MSDRPTSASPSVEQVREALNEVYDPEIPVLTLPELGVIRGVHYEGSTLVVSITPTFAGCPALEVMKTSIRERLQAMGLGTVQVRTVLSPPWTSDWITPEGRAKLRGFGLAPPLMHGGEIELMLVEQATCPHCDSEDTVLQNSFGPTPCRAIYVCRACQQPFEQFKPL